MELTLTQDWCIELVGADPVAQFAAAELRVGLALLGAPELPLVEASPGPRIALAHGPAGEGFVRAQDPAGLSLRGDGSRGLLYAVYDLLEALGLHWPAPASVAASSAPGPLRLPGGAVADRPALPVRGLVLGHDHFLAEAEGWISWAARNRLNTIFVHTTIHEPALGACRLASWRTRRRTLLPLMRARGLRLELGGHHLRDLLPRRLFRREPALFRHDGRRRSPDHNLCVSNPRALALLRSAATAFYRAYPEAEVYHLWPDDLRAGGWCHCSACAALSPADQAILAANVLAEALPPERPAARVSFLAYHDTAAASAVAPHPAVSLAFAPRLRSYAAGLDAPANAPVAAQLAACVAAFGGGGPEPRAALAAFEYYLDGILFKSSPPPLPAVIGADLAHYRAAGVGAAHALLTGDRPFLQAPPNAYLFARLAWAPAADPAAVLADYAAARVPADPAALVAAYDALAAAWRPTLARDPDEPPPPRAARLRDPVGAPPADVLDPLAEPGRAAAQRLEALRHAEDDLARGRAAWAALEAPGAAALLAAERAEWELGAALLDFMRLRQQLYVVEARAAPAAILFEALAQAQAALDALLAWAELHVPPSARAGHLLLRAAFQLQLDQIADRGLLGPLARLSLRARRAGDLARLLPWLVR